jgi:hypothetical protein
VAAAAVELQVHPPLLPPAPPHEHDGFEEPASPHEQAGLMDVAAPTPDNEYKEGGSP